MEIRISFRKRNHRSTDLRCVYWKARGAGKRQTQPKRLQEWNEIVNYFDVSKSFMLCAMDDSVYETWMLPLPPPLSIRRVENVKAMPIIKVNIVSSNIRDIFSHYIKVHFAVWKWNVGLIPLSRSLPLLVAFVILILVRLCRIETERECRKCSSFGYFKCLALQN